MKVIVSGIEKELIIKDQHGIDYAKDFIFNLVGSMPTDEEGKIIMSVEDYEYWKPVINKEYEINSVLFSLNHTMREYVKSSYEHLYNTDIENYPDLAQVKNAIAQKLYEDLDSEKSEGFAQYCAATAQEILDGKFDTFEEIQEELNLLLEEME